MTTHDADRSVPDESPGSEAATDGSLVAQATDGSAVITQARQLGAIGVALVRESALYHWLTAEPEPEVIVIDLRETWTVGPFIALLDRIVAAVTEAVASSRLVGAGRRVAVQTRETPLRVGGGLALVVGVAAMLTALAGGEVQRGRLLVGVGTLVLGILGVRDDRSIDALRATQVGEALARGGALVIQALEPPEPPEETTPEDRETGSVNGDTIVDRDQPGRVETTAAQHDADVVDRDGHAESSNEDDEESNTGPDMSRD